MACRVITTEEYESRLETAAVFRLENYGRASALALLDREEDVEALLASMPFVGSTIERFSDEIPDGALRWIKVESYVAVYRYSKLHSLVTLEGLFYGSSDWRRALVRRVRSRTASDCPRRGGPGAMASARGCWQWMPRPGNVQNP